jgi:hypothetical protein
MRPWVALIALTVVLGLTELRAQQGRPRPEARQGDATETWRLADQSWDFKDVLMTYAPVRGTIDSSDDRGDLAVWKLQLVHDMEDGAARLHEEMRGSPFKIVLLDRDRTVINPDVQARITPVPAKMGDVIEMYVPLPTRELLQQVRYIRVQRRTDVGF